MERARAPVDRLFTREEYRAWYEAQPGRYERVDGRIVAMAPERVVHGRMKFRVATTLDRAVRAAGVACEVLPDSIAVETGDSDFEPDALVNCGARMPDDAVAATNPVVVVEVLSPGTASVDTNRKLAGYFAVASIQHYLIVNPTRRMVIHHRREADAIATRILASGPVTMHPPGIEITVEELYEDPLGPVVTV